MSLSKIVNSLLGAYLGAHLLFSPIKTNAYEPLRGTWSDELIGKIHRSYTKEDFKKGSTHPYICYEASKIITNPRLKSEIQKYTSNFIEGSVIEDNLLPSGLPRSVNHFYDKMSHKGIKLENFISPSEYYDFKGPLDAMSALEWALSDENNLNFNKGVEAYKRGNFYFAYKVTGAISHLIQDVGVPAHAKSDIHPNGESYEKYCGEVFNIENMLAERTPDYSDLKPIKFNSLEEFFNYVSSISGEFDSDNTLRKNRQYLSKADLADYSETLIPLAIQATAGFLEYFYEYANQDNKSEQNLGINIKNLEEIINELNNQKVYLNNTLITPERVEWFKDRIGIVTRGSGKIYLVDLNNKMFELQDIRGIFGHEISFCDNGSFLLKGVKDGHWGLFFADKDRSKTLRISDINNEDYADISNDCSNVIFTTYSVINSTDIGSLDNKVIYDQKKNYSKKPVRVKFSKDGSKISLTLAQMGNKDLYIMNPDGSNLEKILEGKITLPEWRNNNEILFAKELQGNREVFSYNLTTKTSKRITFNDITEYSISISDDGNLLLVCGDRKIELIDLNNLEQ